MQITPPPDSLDIRHPNFDFVSPDRVRQAERYNSNSRIRSSQDHTADPETPQIDRRIEGERRRQERRQENEPVSIDTRTSQERRTEIRRRIDRETKS